MVRELTDVRLSSMIPWLFVSAAVAPIEKPARMIAAGRVVLSIKAPEVSALVEK
jgi:hypothetical protein